MKTEQGGHFRAAFWHFSLFLLAVFFCSGSLSARPRYYAVKLQHNGANITFFDGRLRINNKNQVLFPSTNFSQAGDSIFSRIWENGALVPFIHPAGMYQLGIPRMNDLGRIASHAFWNGENVHTHPFSADIGGLATEIQPLPGAHRHPGNPCLLALAFDINNAGAISGISGDTTEVQFEQRIRLVVWKGGVPEVQPNPPGFDPDSDHYLLSDNIYINNLDQLAGNAIIDGQARGFTSAGGGAVISPFSGGIESRVQDINDAGQVVGYATGDFGGGFESGTHAFLWENGAKKDIHGSISGTASVKSTAFGINDSGWVAGNFFTSEAGAIKAFLHWKDTTFDLRTLVVNNTLQTGEPVGTFYVASDINNSGVIVGGGASTARGTPFFSGRTRMESWSIPPATCRTWPPATANALPAVKT